MKLTRRELVAALAPAAALAQSAGPSRSATPASPAEELTAAQGRLKANSEALSKLAVPIEIEPAFQFRA